MLDKTAKEIPRACSNTHMVMVDEGDELLKNLRNK